MAKDIDSVEVYELMEVIYPQIYTWRPLDCPGDMKAFQEGQALATRILAAGYRKNGNQSNKT